MMTDPISDMLTRVRNGYMAKRTSVSMPWSKMKESLATILSKEGYVGKIDVLGEIPRRELSVFLSYDDQKQGRMSSVRKVSKPGMRIYASWKDLPLVRKGSLGIAIVSTPMGLMTTRDAAKKNLGGEVICELD